MAQDAFGRACLWLGNLQLLWWGWRRSRPLVAFYRLAPDHPMAICWRTQAFIGPLEIRHWVPKET